MGGIALTVFSGKIRFFSAEEGGRRTGPPSGPRYWATAVKMLGDDVSRPENWPWSGGQFSVILDFSHSSMSWERASIQALAPEAPEAGVLRPGAELAILEGPKQVALFVVDDE